MTEERNIVIYVEPPVDREEIFGPFTYSEAQRESDRLTWSLRPRGGRITFVDAQTLERLRPPRIIRPRG